jgi:hypothetical protein
MTNGRKASRPAVLDGQAEQAKAEVAARRL